MKRQYFAGLLIATCSLGITAALADEGNNGDEAKANACFQTKRVHTIRRLDEFHVVAELLGGERYVLGVEDRCRGLEKAVQFTIISRGTRVCPASFAELVFIERSKRSDQCRIETVALLSEASREEHADTEAAEPNGKD